MAVRDNFTFNWKSKSDSFKSRSTDGVLCLIIDDTTLTGINEYSNYKKVKRSTMSEENKSLISDLYANEDLRKVIIVAYNSEGGQTLDEAIKLIEDNNVKYNYLACEKASSSEDKQKLIQHVKLQRREGNRKATVVLSGVSDANYEGVISIELKDITLIDGTEITPERFSLYYAAAATACDLSTSMTYHKFKYVKKVTLPNDVDEDDIEDNGGVYLFFDNDLDVIVASQGINTKTIFTGDESQELKYIRTDRILNMIYTDIRNLWKTNYLGVNNSYKRKKLLITDLNSYLRGLASQEILDDSKENYTELDREAIVDYLEAEGVDTSKLKDEELFSYDTDVNVFVTGQINITKTMEKITINMEA